MKLLYGLPLKSNPTSVHRITLLHLLLSLSPSCLHYQSLDLWISLGELSRDLARWPYIAIQYHKVDPWLTVVELPYNLLFVTSSEASTPFKNFNHIASVVENEIATIATYLKFTLNLPNL